MVWPTWEWARQQCAPGLPKLSGGGHAGPGAAPATAAPLAHGEFHARGASRCGRSPYGAWAPPARGAPPAATLRGVPGSICRAAQAGGAHQRVHEREAAAVLDPQLHRLVARACKQPQVADAHVADLKRRGVGRQGVGGGRCARVVRMHCRGLGLVRARTPLLHGRRRACSLPAQRQPLHEWTSRCYGPLTSS